MEVNGAYGAARVRKGFSLFGLLLVAFGILLLLSVVGALSLGVWFELVRYWPALLILAGVKMILAPRAPLVGLTAVSLIIVAIVAAASYTMDFQRTSDASAAPVVASYEAPLGDAETLELGMGFAGGEVTLNAAPPNSSQSSNLFAANFDGAPADVIYDKRGRDSKIYLSTGDWSVNLDGAVNVNMAGDIGDFPGVVDWDLLVSPDVALALEIESGASDLDLDLRRLNVKRLFIGAAASDMRIVLPERAGETEVVIEAGAADVEIIVPAGVAARFEQHSLLSQLAIDASRFPETPGGYESPGYATAQNRARVEVAGFASDLAVR